MIFPFLLALLLGFKHSYDADHILAVSNLLSKTKSMKNVVKMSISWSAGHMITASIVTVILFYSRDYLISNFLSYFEYIVALMLIGLGIFSLVNFKFAHFHMHTHVKRRHDHLHMHAIKSENHHHKTMFGIGIVQGLASNDELLILFVVSLTFTTLTQIIAGVFLFSLGVVAGMLVYSMILNRTITMFGDGTMKVINIGSGIFSIGYGLFLLLGI